MITVLRNLQQNLFTTGEISAWYAHTTSGCTGDLKVTCQHVPCTCDIDLVDVSPDTRQITRDGIPSTRSLSGQTHTLRMETATLPTPTREDTGTMLNTFLFSPGPMKFGTPALDTPIVACISDEQGNGSRWEINPSQTNFPAYPTSKGMNSAGKLTPARPPHGQEAHLLSVSPTSTNVTFASRTTQMTQKPLQTKFRRISSRKFHLRHLLVCTVTRRRNRPY
ncbi:hypothetical protein BV25DRAFT_589502 [Artomyces pyxidatus]|uniref:Uncharacterized protein n=1 Tax=Artomyces pyxidatus TaxID=48021 RepID=A0ACB8T397_9AGAM|nr:hypothetical protein BV25DRAFT_589502 [Artomyces pyxidatus]